MQHKPLISQHAVCRLRPHETPFEDGTFKLTLEFTEEYPNKPPTVRFVSKMFHPNGKPMLRRPVCEKK